MEAKNQLRGPPPPPLLSLPSSSSSSSSIPKHNPSTNQSSRIQSFNALLNPQDLMPGHTVSDLYALRHLTRASGGLPESHRGSDLDWLRPVAWKVLLGFIPVEKKEWGRTLAKRREEYYQFLSDLLPTTSTSASPTPDASLPGSLSERDSLLDQIYKDLSRSKKNAFAFYSEELPFEDYSPSSSTNPQYQDSANTSSDQNSTSKPFKRKPKSEVQIKVAKKVEIRRKLLKRLAKINNDYSTSLDQSKTPTAASFKGKEKESSSNDRNQTSSISTSNTDPNLLSTTSTSENEKLGSESPHIFLSPPSPGKSGNENPSSSTSSFSSALEGDEDGDQTSTRDSSKPVPPRIPRMNSSGLNTEEAQDLDFETFKDVRWHSLLRILYIYALLNPSTGYIQGMNEVVFVILYVLGNVSKSKRGDGSSSSSDPTINSTSSSSPTEEDLESQALHELNYGLHSEADAFWCFSALIGEVRELYEFDEIDHKEAGLRVTNSRNENDGISNSSLNGDDRRKKGETGMAGALKRFSRRLFWLDEELWKALKLNSLDPRLPYYSFRWLACLVSTELSLPSLVRVWDALLTEERGPAQPDLDSNSKDQGDGSAKIEFLIDLCCALLINIRGPLLEAIASPLTNHQEEEEEEDSSGEAFAKAIRILQDYPDEDIQPVVELAYIYRQRRLASGLTGDGPPIDDELMDQTVGLGGTSISAKDKISAAFRGWTGNTPQASPISSYSGVGFNGSTPNRSGIVNGNRTPSSSSTSRWFSSVGRSASGSSNLSSEQHPQTPPLSSVEKVTPGSGSNGMFSRYAEALQSSDAAASLSKTSSNWMASWSNRGTLTNNNSNELNGSPSNASRNSTPSRPGLPSSFTSALGAGSEFLKKVRSASGSETSNNSSYPSASSHHPASFRWSRDVTPDFPLPNVLDSPDGRTEYIRPRPESGIFYSRNYSNSSNKSNGMRSSSPTPGSEGGLASPTFSNGNGSPNLLPSMRAAQQQARSTSGSGSSALRGAGPKPLLLGGSARPPKEGSGSIGLPSHEEPTRKVSSGPLAHAAASPEARAAAKSRRLSSLSNASQGGSSIGYYSHHQRAGTSSSSTTNGNGYSSRRSSMVSSRDSKDGDGDSSTIASVVSSVISVGGGNEPSIPPLLPSMAAAIQANGTLPQPLTSPPTSTSTNASSTQGLGLQGSRDGKMSAGAFAKVRAVNGGGESAITSQTTKPSTSTPPSAWQDPQTQRSSYPSSSTSSSSSSATSPNVNSSIPFGQVSSSSDTPLVPTSSIKSRKLVRRKASASSLGEKETTSPPISEKGIGLGFNNVSSIVSSPQMEESQYFPDRIPRSSNSPRGSITSISSDKKPNSNRVSAFESPRPAPNPPPTKIRSGTRKYNLTEIVPVPIEKDDIEQLNAIRGRSKSGSISSVSTNNTTSIKEKEKDDQDVPIDTSSINGIGGGNQKPSRGSGSGIIRSRRTTQESIKSVQRDSKGSLSRKTDLSGLSSSSTTPVSSTAVSSESSGMNEMEHEGQGQERNSSGLKIDSSKSLIVDKLTEIPPPSPGENFGDMLTADQLLKTLELEANESPSQEVMMERGKALGVPVDLNDDDEEEDFTAHDAGLEGIGNTLILE